MTEGTDAVSIVVSEETGVISFIEGGSIERNLSTRQLRNALLTAMDIPLDDENAKDEIEESVKKRVTDSDTKVPVG